MYAYCRFDDYPVTPGHLLIIPYRHIISFFDATNEEQAAMMELVRSGKEYLDGLIRSFVSVKRC
jgi:diadenosine tetraphosphate (Ap4A) HIT family hydrolase